MEHLFAILRAWRKFADLDLSAKSVHDYATYIHGFVFRWDRVVDPLTATTDSVLEYIRSKGPKGRANGTAKRALRHFFGFLHGAGHRPDNPAALLPREKTTHRVPDFFDEEAASEVTQIIYAAAAYDDSRGREPEWALSILFLFATGARVGEACALRLSDVDIFGRRVTFRVTKTRRERIVHLGPAGMFAAAALMDIAIAEKRPNLLGIRPPAMRGRLKVLARLTGLDPVRMHPHALRHSCGTLLSERGATETEVMEHLGQTDPRMAQLYQHVSSKRAKRVADLIE